MPDPAAANGTDIYTFTPLTTGAASTTGGYNSSTPYFAVGQSALARLAQSDTHDGSLANFRRLSSPDETVGAGNSVFVGTSGGFALLDSSLALASAASASFGYAFSPAGELPATPGGITTGAAADGSATTSTPDDAPVPSGVIQTTGPEIATVTVRPAVAAAPAYIYTPLGQAAVAATGRASAGSSGGAGGSMAVGRGFASAVPGASVFNTRDLVDDALVGSASAKIPVSAINSIAAKAFSRILQTAAGAANHGDDALANLTIDGYTSPSADASYFNISLLPDDSDVSQDTSLPVPLMVVGTGGGELPSSLTIFTADTTGLNGAGDSFTYFLNRAIVH